MKRRNGLVLIAALAAGCSGYGAGLVPGRSSVEEVRAAMGAPTLVRLRGQRAESFDQGGHPLIGFERGAVDDQPG